MKLKNIKFKSLRQRVLPPVLTFFLVGGLFEFLVRWGWVQKFVVPAPSQVIRMLFLEHETLWEATLSTFKCASLGFLLSAFVGVTFALLFSLSSFLRRAIYPYAVFFQTVPIISIAPLLVIWFGFGQPTVVISSFIVSVFPVIANTLLGLQSTDPQLLDLFALYRASSSQVLFKLSIPFALPSIFSGLRVSSGLAVVGTIVGEFIAGGGLGGVVDSARTQQRLDLVFAAILMSSLLGLVFMIGINYFSAMSLQNWHASEKTSI